MFVLVIFSFAFLNTNREMYRIVQYLSLCLILSEAIQFTFGTQNIEVRFR